MGTGAPIDPVAAIAAGSSASLGPFAAGSRYALVPLATTLIDGVEVRHLRRRFVPQPSRFAAIREHAVAESERADTIAAAEIGDPEAFWMLADANGAVHPDELVAEIGRRLRITLPEGIPGAPDAG